MQFPSRENEWVKGFWEIGIKKKINLIQWNRANWPNHLRVEAK